MAHNNPEIPDEFDNGSNPASPSESSEASTPYVFPSASSEGSPDVAFTAASSPFSGNDLPRRVPSLRTVSDPSNSAHMSPSSSLSGTLNNARRPPPSVNSLPNDLMAKTRAFAQGRLGAPRPNLPSNSSGFGPSFESQRGGSLSPMGGMGSLNMGGAVAGLPALKLPPGSPLHRPKPPGSISAPVIPSAAGNRPMGLSARRAMKLGNLPGGSPGASTPKLSDINGGQDREEPAINGEGRGSKLSDFKNYIDAEKGWITFEGAATITRTGVNFANGKTFSISLDEIEVLDELGKGNYGTVYKVRHAKPKAPRFGQGLSGFKKTSRQSSLSEKEGAHADDSADTSPSGAASTSGVVMAMKEIRLELDESKFGTILKELVILHECVSPYIIDFYGAFFQEGAVYMCIEYMDGGSIDKLYAGGIPEPILRKITYSTIMGLKTLKDDHNIIHRDVKPTNILVSTRGHVKICDFGVSGNLVASIAKTNIGCQSYMAPERISGGGMSAAGGAVGTYSVQSDIWSLGLTIIECAMGKYPYPPEISNTIFSQLSAIVEGDPPKLPSEGYSSTAQDFVRSCLNKVPSKRHTYPMLLAHPWMAPLAKIETIAEDAEAEDAAAGDGLADAAGALDLQGAPGIGDRDVAAWVRDALERKRNGSGLAAPGKPALHAAPLDSVSPAGTPVLAAEGR